MHEDQEERAWWDLEEKRTKAAFDVFAAQNCKRDLTHQDYADFCEDKKVRLSFGVEPGERWQVSETKDKKKWQVAVWSAVTKENRYESIRQVWEIPKDTFIESVIQE